MFLDPDGPEASQLLGFPITQVNNHPSLFSLVWVWFLQLAETVSTIYHFSQLPPLLTL